MKNVIFTLICLILAPWVSFADESSVYKCRIEDDLGGTLAVRMKKFFDAHENMDLGKVDLLENDEVIESTRTKVYQIPLYNQQSFIQLWNDPNGVVRVDAQLTHTQGVREFYANYFRNDEKRRLVCRELKD